VRENVVNGPRALLPLSASVKATAIRVIG